MKETDKDKKMFRIFLPDKGHNLILEMLKTFHFKSAADINTDILEVIKKTFKNKAVDITIQIQEEADEVESNIPPWHKEMVLERWAQYEKGQVQTLPFDKALDDIEKNFK